MRRSLGQVERVFERGPLIVQVTWRSQRLGPSYHISVARLATITGSRPMDASTVRILGKPLHCRHCNGERFIHQQFEIERAFGTAWIWMHMWAKLANVYPCPKE